MTVHYCDVDVVVFAIDTGSSQDLYILRTQV